MTLTSIELIDVLRQTARQLEAETAFANFPLPLHRLMHEIKAAGICATEPEAGFAALTTTQIANPDKVAGYLHSCADVLENQLLAILDLPVDINFIRRAA